jgi:hypothetical protein
VATARDVLAVAGAHGRRQKSTPETVRQATADDVSICVARDTTQLPTSTTLVSLIRVIRCLLRCSTCSGRLKIAGRIR